jgi:hypothetical protein
MGFRVKLLLVFGGGFLAFFSFQEYRLGREASLEPVPASLASLESGEALPNVHVALGEHLCLYGASVYQYQTRSGSDTPGVSTKIDYAYFPIISPEHPWMDQVRSVVLLHGGQVEAVPNNAWPEIEQFTVLVKSKKRFKTVGDIPDLVEVEDGVTGLVVNRIRKLGGKERELVQQAFPKADLDKVLILEEGRTPKTATATLGLAGVGIAVALAGLAWFAVGARS